MVSKSKEGQTEPESTRTTLSLDNDVLLLIRQRAAVSGESLGKTVSELIRQSVTHTSEENPRFYDGVRLLPTRPGGTPVTTELINELLDEMS